MLEIIFQDEYFVAVNKPAGMLVHRSWLDKHETQFVMQTLRDQIGQHVFPLHRLDRPTSGVLVFALSSEVAAQVMPMFANHEMQKTYHAIVRGWIEEGATLDYPLKVELDKIADKFARADKEAQEAITDYQPLGKVEVPLSTGRFPTSRYGLVEMKPKTGRKHQLRRHMAHLRHPIVGDTSHGDGKHNKLFRDHYDSHRLLLHASELSFIHPFTGKELVMKAAFDPTWQQLLTQFEWLDIFESSDLLATSIPMDGMPLS
ncbi:tRNA pseudouridine(65) synthase TruC [Vibrio sp. 10N.286.49.B3]|uniref:tRNA pseudouridine(65) synthase TruC n=1 Tax=Vibrio sp. 10N.286.49.B3 TaxID=1880855 RepID=UPI000C85928D|nr:tRNA pseudouridine(65) synthase TruC [Vibrio sp. 10N.286.49.B3]PMH41107.1 tRNA pseudouridine(65) synthase TruC [Vibrio sp. 10N.286.49.B3]